MISTADLIRQDTVVTLPLPTLDAFAGAGGLSLGLQAAGLPVTVAADNNLDALQTYRHHHGKTEILEGDIADRDFSRYKGNIAIVVGGPPCQPWSTGGKQLGHADGRDGLAHFIQIVDQVRPLAFLMENVPGLTAPANLQYFEALLRGLRELKYKVEFNILDATSYKVPQRRRRLFVVGTPLGQKFIWPKEVTGPGTPTPARTAGEFVSAATIVGDPNPAKVTFAKNPVIRPNPFAGLLFNGGGRPLNLAAPAPTVLASAGGNRTLWIDTDQILAEYHTHLRNGGLPRSGIVPGARRLTVAEVALLQTFPANLTFAGSQASQYIQVGNAVPPGLAAAMARALVQSLGSEAIAAAA